MCHYIRADKLGHLLPCSIILSQSFAAVGHNLKRSIVSLNGKIVKCIEQSCSTLVFLITRRLKFQREKLPKVWINKILWKLQKKMFYLSVAVLETKTIFVLTRTLDRKECVGSYIFTSYTFYITHSRVVSLVRPKFN